MKRRDFVRSGLLAGLVAPFLKTTGPAVELPAVAPPELERPAADRYSDFDGVALAADGSFIAVGPGKIIYSKDGITWTERGIRASKFQNR